MTTQPTNYDYRLDSPALPVPDAVVDRQKATERALREASGHVSGVHFRGGVGWLSLEDIAFDEEDWRDDLAEVFEQLARRIRSGK